MTDVEPVEVLKQAREFSQGPVQTDFLVVRKQSSGPEVGELGIGRQAQQELNEIVSEALTSRIESLRGGRTQSRELDVVNTLSSESIIQHTSIDNVPDSELFDLLTTRDDYPSTKYTDGPEPNFQLIRQSDTSGNVLIGVQNYQNTTLVETTSALAFLFQGEEYERFDGEMIVVRKNLNALYFDGQLFVMTPRSFESMFDMREEYEESAHEAISKYQDSGIKFQDPDKIEGWLLSHINMLREMYEIHDSGLPDRTEPEAVISLIDDFGLKIDYRRKNGDVHLDIDDYTQSWKLLRLLGAKYAETEEMGTRWEIDQGRRL